MAGSCSSRAGWRGGNLAQSGMFFGSFARLLQSFVVFLLASGLSPALVPHRGSGGLGLSSGLAFFHLRGAEVVVFVFASRTLSPAPVSGGLGFPSAWWSHGPGGRPVPG